MQRISTTARMQQLKIKQIILLFAFMLPTTWCGAVCSIINDGYSHITVKERKHQGTPKGSTIDASINGHTLTVAFTENLGQVTVEVASVSGSDVSTTTVYTPNGMQACIPVAGDYIVTFTLPNGDEYYGEFTVTD